MSILPVAVVTDGPSDMLTLLRRSGARLRILRPGRIPARSLEGCGSLAVLGGTAEKALLPNPRARVEIERFIASGRRVFAEYCESVSDTLYCAQPASTRFERLVWCGDGTEAAEGAAGLRRGDLLDDQCNTRLAPWYSGSRTAPWMQYVGRVVSHARMEVTGETVKGVKERALWLERENLLVCSFRIADFRRARFAPAAKWAALADRILRWLCGVEARAASLPAAYALGPRDADAPLEARVREAVERGVRWFSASGMLLDGGRGGVLEGPGTEIYADGRQRVSPYVRNDCTGEASLAFLAHHMLTGSRRSLATAGRLASLCFDCLRISDGPYRGMMRWSDAGWGVCYQDDVARSLIPQLLRCLYLGDRTYLDRCVETLRFLVRTTGTDGTRVSRTDILTLTPEEAARLASSPGALPSGHYNSWYHAALLLAHKLTGIEEFRATGVRGLETIMAAYPDTKREISETEELCRLVLPLSFLFWATGEERHRAFLHRVTDDMERFRHASGAYLEWDTGYKASLARNLGGEASLLSKNGDPVVEMLYSLNWLPMGLAQAYLVTGDRKFSDLWRRISEFLVRAQIRSANRLIDGAWTRALDVDLMEVYGLSNDIGWGPWAIESGWTVGEITAGMAVGLMGERLRPKYA